MPHQIGPVEDPFKVAARHAIAGDFSAAVDAIEKEWIERCVDDFQPNFDEDEDGPYGNPQSDMRKRAEMFTDGTLDSYVGDAAYELLASEMSEEEAVAKAEQIGIAMHAEMQKHVENIADQAYDEWSDGQAYSRDKHAYYGVKRSDFF